MNYKKIALLIYSIIGSFMLSACSNESSSSNILSEFDNLISPTPDTLKKPQTRSHEKIGKPVQVIPYNYTEISKKPTPQAKSVIAKKDVEVKPTKTEIVNKPVCKNNLFLSEKTVSNLYKIYKTVNKDCIEINDPKITKHFTDVLVQTYSSQDTRILNVDKKFLYLYSNAIMNADIQDKILLNQQILNNGCHLLKPDSCALIKKALY